MPFIRQSGNCSHNFHNRTQMGPYNHLNPTRGPWALFLMFLLCVTVTWRSDWLTTYPHPPQVLLITQPSLQSVTMCEGLVYEQERETVCLGCSDWTLKGMAQLLVFPLLNFCFFSTIDKFWICVIISPNASLVCHQQGQELNITLPLLGSSIAGLFVPEDFKVLRQMKGKMIEYGRWTCGVVWWAISPPSWKPWLEPLCLLPDE